MDSIQKPPGRLIASTHSLPSTQSTDVLTKGRDGSPTYDERGFEMDWDKVNESIRPSAYNKHRAVRGMKNAVAKMQREMREMFECFFDTTVMS